MLIPKYEFQFINNFKNLKLNKLEHSIVLEIYSLISWTWQVKLVFLINALLADYEYQVSQKSVGWFKSWKGETHKQYGDLISLPHILQKLK
jgi:hypothetical protein